MGRLILSDAGHARVPAALLALASLLAALGLLLVGSGLKAAPPAPVVVLDLDGPVSPASADYAVRGIARAAKEGAQLIVLRMDTPGGLDTSMRAIIKAILASPVPVATYVAPSGARAASAGTFILYASHVAAMAPGTNLGAASPVAIGGGEPAGGAPAERKSGKDGRGGDSKDTMTRKSMNDAAAYIRSLAQLRGRNAEWGERAVREAVSLPATEARKLGVIDLVAADMNDLLRQIDGRRITVNGEVRTLATADAARTEVAPDWRTRLLAVIAHPSVALVLMMIGIYGLFFEFSNPGYVAPGVIGGISLLLALYALQLLPISYAGLALIALGVALMIAELFVPSFGALGIGGIVALAIGAVILVDTDVPGYGIPWTLIAGITASTAVFIATVGGLALKAQRRPVVSGREELVGSTGEVVKVEGRETWAHVHGELWKVASRTALVPGQRVRVVAVAGLELEVVPETVGARVEPAAG
jgi:membrane-bound serine protease (ClpP class)